MSAEGGPPPRVRRMLPSVSEVLKELTARGTVEPDVAFRAAREVCAEELKRIRDAGGDSVPLEELVERAWARATGGARPAPRPPAEPVFDLAPPAPAEEPGPLAFATEPEPGALAVSPEPPGAATPLLFDEPPAPAAEPAVEDPFSETTGAMDLRWDREAREPFSEPHAAVAPVDAPTLPETAVVSGGSGPLSFGDAPVVPFALPAPVEEDAEGPGDETLSRLSREAEAIDLNSVFPGAGERAAVPFAVSARQPEGPAAAEPVPFDDEEDTVLTVPGRGRRRTTSGKKGPRIGLLLGTAAGLVGLAGLGYLLAGLWMERDAAPPPTPVARPRPTATPSVVAAVPAGPERLPAAEAPVTGPAPVATAPAPAATVAPTAAAVPTAPQPLPRAPVVAATAVPAVTAPALAPVARSRDGLVVTRDRAGRPEVYSIHFTSYKDRASAERDLKRVQALAGREGFVAEVDLGEKGTWYRVMIGEFPTSPEAKAARAELAAKGTPDMGWVYRVVGPEAAAPR